MSSMYLKLADGTILDGSSAGASENGLWLYLQDATFPEVLELVNPIVSGEIDSTIEFHFGSMYSEFTGYTKIKRINVNRDTVDVMLTGGSVVKENIRYEGDVAENGADVVSSNNGDESGNISPNGEDESDRS